MFLATANGDGVDHDLIFFVDTGDSVLALDRAFACGHFRGALSVMLVITSRLI